MSTDRQDIDLALSTLERINEDMTHGRIGPTSRPGHESGVWELDPCAEGLAWVANWWRDYRDEDPLPPELNYIIPPRGRARRTVEAVVTGLLAVEQLGREHHNEATRLEARMTALLDLIELRGKLQIRERIKGTVNWWLVFGAATAVVVAAIAIGRVTIMQVIPLLGGFALIVVVKVVLLDRPIRRWRSRIAELEQAMPDRD